MPEQRPENYEIEWKGPATVSAPDANGLSFVQRRYSFTTYIVAKAGSAGLSVPRLGKLNGNIVQNLALPLDPSLMFSRTGVACYDEDQFPRNSIDPYMQSVYFDDSCKKGPGSDGQYGTCLYGETGCHCSFGADQSCKVAMQQVIRLVDLSSGGAFFFSLFLACLI